jgi:site-specific recombinase XerD
MFLLRGINYKDLVKLTQQNIINKRIVYERSKTKTVYSIGLEVEIENLLEKLAHGNLNLTGVMEKEFHLIDQDIEVLKRYNQYLHLFNNHLKRIGKLLELETKLSSYVMRYSYANIARNLGFSVEEISYLLGHKSSTHAVTEIYLEHYDLKKLDAINRKIIHAITGR